MTRFGLVASWPAAWRRLRHFHFIAMPPRWMASELPIVLVPTACSPVDGAWYMPAMMLTHRRSMIVVIGYSS